MNVGSNYPGCEEGGTSSGQQAGSSPPETGVQGNWRKWDRVAE